jgi:uncharacterized OB-fold protein
MELEPGQYIGTDGDVHEESEMSGADCNQCGYEVGPDGYCEECGADNNC